MKLSLLQLVTDHYGLSEHEAVGLIMSGKVLVDDRPVTKVGIKFNDDILTKPNGLRIKSLDKYVSRGAYKLLGALTDFAVDVTGLTCLDIGSSTGGFTDVLLQRGAAAVYAVDCGSNQLDYRLRNDPRVTVYENHSIQNMTAADFPSSIDLAVMDVSFTSCVGIIQHIFEHHIAPLMIALIKPQFEYSRLKGELDLSFDFDGIIRDESLSRRIAEHVCDEIAAISGVSLGGFRESKIKGTKGNVEYLVWMKKE